MEVGKYQTVRIMLAVFGLRYQECWIHWDCHLSRKASLRIVVGTAGTAASGHSIFLFGAARSKFAQHKSQIFF